VGSGPEALAKGRLLKLTDVAGKASTSLAAITVALDGLSADLKAEFIRGFKQGFDQALQNSPPAQTEAEEKFRETFAAEMMDFVKLVVNQGRDLSLSFDIDRKAQDVAMSLSFRGRQGTQLAKSIKGMEDQPRLAPALVGANSRMHIGMSMTLPDKIRKGVVDAFAAGFEKGLQGIKDPAEARLAKSLLKALQPTLLAGQLDGALDLRGPKNGVHTIVMGAKVKNGRDLEALFRKELPKKDQVKLDVASVGDVKIHRIIPDPADFDEDTKKLIGTEPVGHIAFRDDALLLAMGVDSLASIKQAIAAEPKSGPIVQLEMSCAFIAPFIKENPNAAAVARNVFKGKTGDRIRFTVEGGDSVRLRFRMDIPVLRFFAEIGAQENADALIRQ
jgi:hypothetical protein